MHHTEAELHKIWVSRDEATVAHEVKTYGSCPKFVRFEAFCELNNRIRRYRAEKRADRELYDLSFEANQKLLN